MISNVRQNSPKVYVLVVPACATRVLTFTLRHMCNVVGKVSIQLFVTTYISYLGTLVTLKTGDNGLSLAFEPWA